MCLNEYYLHAIELYQLDYDITNAKTQFLQIGTHAKKSHIESNIMTKKKKKKDNLRFLWTGVNAKKVKYLLILQIQAKDMEIECFIIQTYK